MTNKTDQPASASQLGEDRPRLFGRFLEWLFPALKQQREFRNEVSRKNRTLEEDVAREFRKHTG